MGRGIRHAGITTITVTAILTGFTAIGAVGGQAAVPRSSPGPLAATSGSVLFTTLSSSTITVKNSHGRRLHLTLSSTARAGIGKAGLTLTLSTGALGGVGESHAWSFNIPRSGLNYNHRTGHGKLSTGTSLRSFGNIALTFVKTSQSTSTCKGGTGHDTRVSGRLSGKVFFDSRTGPHGWGTVGSRRHTLTFTGTNVFSLLGTGCPIGTGGSATCSNGLFWSAPFATTSPTTSVFGNVEKVGSRTTSTVTFIRSLTLPIPGSNRTDTLVASEPVPTVNTGTLTITTSGHLVTGSAGISATTPALNNYPCKSGGTSHTEMTTLYTGTWTGTPLVAHFSAVGTLDSPTTGSTSFTTEAF
jgi:hypothetical protein